MAKIRYSPAAIRDLEEIGDYIAEELKSPESAIRIVDKIQDAIDKLADFPKMGALLSTRYEDVGDYRHLICGGYLAFYREQSDIVYIDRILYGKRDYITILFGKTPEDEAEPEK